MAASRPSLAAGDRPSPDHSGGAAGAAADPSRPASRREDGRGAQRTAGAAVRPDGSAGIAADRTHRCAARGGRRGSGRRHRLRAARCRPLGADAVRHDGDDGRRRGGNAAGPADAGRTLVSGPRAARHGGLRQRPADRRDAAGKSDHSARAAMAGRKLAGQLRVLERAAAADRGAGAGLHAARGAATEARVGPLVAGLARPPHLAARLHAGRGVGALFRLQRVPARLSARDRTIRTAQRRTDRAQQRPDSGVLPDHGDRPPPGRPQGAVHRDGPGGAAEPGRVCWFPRRR